MKKYLFISLLSICLFQLNVNAQDAKAKEILTKLSEQTQNAKTIKANFKSTLKNTAENIEESREGKLLSAAEKYRIILEDMEVLNDGKNVYTIIKDAEEVQINPIPEEGDMADLSNPTKITTMWKKDFKYEFKSEENIDGKNTHLIHLYPNEPEDKDFHTIQLFINHDSYTIRRIVIKGKSGTDVIYDITDFKIDADIPMNQLSFSKSDYANFEVIDLR